MRGKKTPRPGAALEEPQGQGGDEAGEGAQGDGGCGRGGDEEVEHAGHAVEARAVGDWDEPVASLAVHRSGSSPSRRRSGVAAHTRRTKMRFALSRCTPCFMLAVLGLIVPTVVSACARQRAVAGSCGASPAGDLCVAAPAAAAVGEVVTGIEGHCQLVYQSSDKAFWFTSHGQCLYRVHRGVTTRFTTEHGLPGTVFRDIVEDRDGNILVHTDPGDISKFDGRTFTVLGPETSKNEWRLHADDLWFAPPQDAGYVLRYDGTTLHRLTLPRNPGAEAHIAAFPRDQFPAMKYNPYDVYDIYKDGRGHLWFGTCCTGVYRYDGTTFAWIDKVGVGFDRDESFGVRSIIEDHEGQMMFSSTESRYEALPTDLAAPTAPTAPTTANPPALRLRKAPGLRYRDEPVVFVSSMKDSKGNLWFAVNGGAVVRSDGVSISSYLILHEGKPVWIYPLYEDREGGIWVGSHEHGLYKFNGTGFEKAKY